MRESTHSGALIEQLWWPDVELIWLPLEDLSPPSARYLVMNDGEAVVLTESPAAFNEITKNALQLPLDDAEKVCSYALFFLEITRTMAAPTLLVTEDLPGPIHPLITTFLEAWKELTATEKKELILRLVRVGDGAALPQLLFSIRARRTSASIEQGVETLQAAGFSSEQIEQIDYFRRLPVAALDWAERHLLIQAGRVFFGPDLNRGAQFMDEAPGPELSGELMSEAQAAIVRDPKGGRVVSAAPNAPYLVSVSLDNWAPIDRAGQLLDDNGFKSMWKGHPRPEIGRYGSKSGAPVSFSQGDQLYRLDEAGKVAEASVWHADTAEWLPGNNAQPSDSSNGEDALPEFLERLIQAETLLPSARRIEDYWVVEPLLMAQGDHLIALELKIDQQGVVDCKETALI